MEYKAKILLHRHYGRSGLLRQDEYVNVINLRGNMSATDVASGAAAGERVLWISAGLEGGWTIDVRSGV